MLLSELNRKQKLKFLDLALHTAVIDGDASDQEQRLLNEKLAEVGDDIVKEYNFSLSEDLEDTLKYFKEQSHKVKHIVFLNLIELLMIGGFYNTTEYFFLESIRKELNITADKRKEMIAFFFEYRDLREKAKRICSTWL